MAVTGQSLINTTRIKDYASGQNLSTIIGKRKVSINAFSTSRSFTMPSTTNRVLLPDTAFLGSEVNISIGGTSTTASDGAVMSAVNTGFTVAGTLGTHSITTVSDVRGNTLNLLELRNGVNKDDILSSGKKVWGLLHALDGISDGDAIATNPTENLMASFVVVSDGGGGLVSANISSGTVVEFKVKIIENWKDLPDVVQEGTDGNSADILDPSGTITALFDDDIIRERRYKITTVVPANGTLTLPNTWSSGVADVEGDSLASTSFDSSGANFVGTPKIQIIVDGLEMGKGIDTSAERDVNWVSSGVIEFVDGLQVGEFLTIRTTKTLAGA
jgi:hypothetical protein